VLASVLEYGALNSTPFKKGCLECGWQWEWLSNGERTTAWTVRSAVGESAVRVQLNVEWKATKRERK
jgi:predicted  nucleic acid-binding Zn-ribbon protein